MPTVGVCVCQAEKLILMTDVPGVLRDKDDVDTKYAELNIRQTQELVQEGVIAGGMIPKVEAALAAAAALPNALVKIASGATPGAISAALRSDGGTAFGVGGELIHGS